MVHTLTMTDIAPVLIPALAALVGIVITALVTYLVGQERMSQRVERLANAREKLEDNGLLTRFIDLEIKAELLGSLRTRETRFYLQVFGGLTLVMAIMLVVTLATGKATDSTFSIIMFWVGAVLFVISYFLFAGAFWQHLKEKARSTKHQLPLR